MKKIWLTFLACLTFLCALMTASCTAPSVEALDFGAIVNSVLGGNKEEETGIAFNEGYLDEIVLGDPIMLDEYIDPFFAEDYSAILTCDETGEERDLKVMGQWTTDKPGTYTFTYTVNSGEFAGETISTKIEVIVQKATWQYSRPTMVYRAGETMYFATLKRNLNLMVKSYYNYEFFVKSVSYNEQKEYLTGMNSFTFPVEGTYTFTFGIKTEDGQELLAEQKINVRAKQVLAEGAEAWMEENNITAHDYTYISPNGQVSLDAGYFNNSILNDNVPYIAFNGENGEGYEPGTYVMVDFTGKNLPQVSFFSNEVTPSYTDGKQGVLITNGITGNDGTDFFNTKLNMSRMTVFGPYKASFPEFDNRGRMTGPGSVADPFPISYHALSASDQYRYIVGIEDVSNTHMTLRLLLINMTTMERVCDHKERLVKSDGLGTLNLPDDYYKGSIVLYGRYGQKTTLDKVYMPIEGAGSIYDLDQAAEFKTEYKTKYDLHASANVSDYITIPEGDYEFTVTAPNGEKVAIDEKGNFSYDMSGQYRLFFDPKQEGLRPAAISVRVLYDVNEVPAADFFEKEGVVIGNDDWNLVTNTNEDFIKEGSQSIEYYNINSKNGTITIHLSKSFMEFIFLSREIEGITFEVYTLRDATYKVADQNTPDLIAQDYTGEIAKETWTTLTITRELCMRNYDAYKSKGYSIAIALSAKGEGESFRAREVIYIDNIQLLVGKSTVSSAAQTFMDENNMIAYGYETITDDMSVSLYAGTYAKEWHNIVDDNVPYVAYQGEYGAGSYVVTDFTGKNIPQIAFFVDNITSSLTDGELGVYIHTGMIKKNGQPVSPHDGGRVTIFGPNKMEYGRPDNEGRLGQFGYQTNEPVNSPYSINGLEDGVHYRYVLGVKEAKVGSFTLHWMLINLDTNTVIEERTAAYSGNWLTEDVITGNIVMYGRYNTKVTFDKVYAVYTNVSDIKSIDKVSEILG